VPQRGHLLELGMMYVGVRRLVPRGPAKVGPKKQKSVHKEENKENESWTLQK